METILYRVRVHFPGADSPSTFYFDNKAQAELNVMHGGGEIEKVKITSDYMLEYSPCCTLADLTNGKMDAAITVI